MTVARTDSRRHRTGGMPFVMARGVSARAPPMPSPPASATPGTASSAPARTATPRAPPAASGTRRAPASTRPAARSASRRSRHRRHHSAMRRRVPRVARRRSRRTWRQPPVERARGSAAGGRAAPTGVAAKNPGMDERVAPLPQLRGEPAPCPAPATRVAASARGARPAIAASSRKAPSPTAGSRVARALHLLGERRLGARQRVVAEEGAVGDGVERRRRAAGRSGSRA